LVELQPASFWTRLLKLVDAELSERHDLVIVGGAAIGLKYASTHLTSDIDSVTSTRDRALWSAIGRACRKLQEQEGLRRPPHVGYIGVSFEPPEDWERRRRKVPLSLRRLRVYVPERHDLALSKVSRGLSRDFAALKAMHNAAPFRLRTLVERYEEARLMRVGDNRRFKANFLALAAELFGEDTAVRVEPGLRSD
jgi:hypothetical protein